MQELPAGRPCRYWQQNPHESILPEVRCSSCSFGPDPCIDICSGTRAQRTGFRSGKFDSDENRRIIQEPTARPRRYPKHRWGLQVLVRLCFWHHLEGPYLGDLHSTDEMDGL